MRIANVTLGDIRCEPSWSRLRDWLKRRRPDIVTLQKIGPTEKFWPEDFRSIGYTGKCLGNRRNYRGVAIFVHRNFLGWCNERAPVVRDCELPGDDRNESRFLTLSIGSLSISSVYAPYNEKARVPWLNSLQDHVDNKGYAQLDTLLCGDFNVKFRADGPYGTGYSKAHQDALESLMSLGFRDLYREAHPCPIKSPGWTRGYSEEDCTKGSSRLHLILASTSLTRCLQSACVDVKSRPWPRKDAPPLVVGLDDDDLDV